MMTRVKERVAKAKALVGRGWATVGAVAMMVVFSPGVASAAVDLTKGPINAITSVAGELKTAVGGPVGALLGFGLIVSIVVGLWFSRYKLVMGSVLGLLGAWGFGDVIANQVMTTFNAITK